MRLSNIKLLLAKQGFTTAFVKTNSGNNYYFWKNLIETNWAKWSKVFIFH